MGATSRLDSARPKPDRAMRAAKTCVLPRTVVVVATQNTGEAGAAA
jgi:hypothetical protein